MISPLFNDALPSIVLSELVDAVDPLQLPADKPKVALSVPLLYRAATLRIGATAPGFTRGSELRRFFISGENRTGSESLIACTVTCEDDPTVVSACWPGG